MKKLYLTTLIIAVAMVLAAPSSFAANLLTNSDFEGGGSFPNPTGWKDGWGAGQMETTYSHSPTTSIRFYGGDCGTKQDFVPTGSGTYQLSVYAYSPSGDRLGSGSYGQMKLRWYNAAWGQIGGDVLSDTYTPASPVAWTKLTANSAKPADAAHATVELFSHTTGGTIAFDDASVVVPEPASLLLLGSGLAGLLAFRKRTVK